MIARIRGTVALALTATLLAGAIAAAPASAAFGLAHFDFTATNEDGSPATKAGSHPYAVRTSFDLNYTEPPGSFAIPDGEIKNLIAEQVAGFVGDATAVPRCSTVEFFDFVEAAAGCTDDTAIGLTAPRVKAPEKVFQVPVYNLEPPPGSVARLGFVVAGVPVLIDVGVKESGDHNIEGRLHEPAQTLTVFGGDLELWGNPADPGHDRFRGRCGEELLAVEDTPPGQEIEFVPSSEACPVSASHPRKPFLTLPRSCTGPAFAAYRAESWQNPGIWVEDGIFTPGFTHCSQLVFDPAVEARTTTDSAETGTGLDFSLTFDDEGLKNPLGRAESETKKAVVTLPEGMTVNPSIAEGLGVCTPADLERETISSHPGEGCPNASKIGTVHTETPLVSEAVDGSVFLAQQDDPQTSEPGAENPFDSLIAFYIVLRNENLGVLVKLAAKVEPDSKTGQLVTTLDDAPQLPVSRFDFHFREGQRAPLVSPPRCDSNPSTPELDPYTVEAKLYPWSDPDNPRTVLSSFEITQGVSGGPCPAGGLPPFRPGLVAGTLNNAAGRFSPFNVRLFRSDGEQEFTHFSIKLPPGVVGKLAGIPFCPDAAIAAAKARTGPLGGHEELASPSCPASSYVGRTLVGSGVGPSLAYAPGNVYLAGPYHGAPISIVAITAGVVGPFDIGAVVVREALRINPETAEVFIDATGSDPIPHIVKGIPVHLRDIRVYTDRPEFVLNPTDCTRTSTASTVLGAGLDFASEADDNPVVVSTPFQAADCAALPFHPRLKLSLLGGTRRGAHPKLRATLKMRGIGEAAIAHAQVTLPRSEFLENAHIKTICTRAQFKQGSVPGEQCPQGSVYGFAKAVTPILDQPLEGPVFLRSSEHKLPDLVAALHNGQIEIVLVGRVDSVNGGIRNTFEVVPDAPVDSFTLTMQGGRKGLLVNSTDLCKGTHRAKANFTGHNGKVKRFRPALQAKCGKAHKRGKRKRSGR